MTGARAAESIFEEVGRIAEGRDRLSIGDLIDGFGRRAYGPLIFVIGLASVSPLNAIPGASVIFAVFVALLAVQYVGRDGAPWAPRWIRDRTLSAERARAVAEKAAPWGRRLGSALRRRATWATEPPWIWFTAAVLAIFALSMIPLDIVPGGIFLQGVAILLMGLAITVGDGVVLIVASALGLGASAAASLGLALWLT